MQCRQIKDIKKTTPTMVYPARTPSGLPPGAPAPRCELPNPVQLAQWRADQKVSAQRYRQAFNRK